MQEEVQQLVTHLQEVILVVVAVEQAQQELPLQIHQEEGLAVQELHLKLMHHLFKEQAVVEVQQEMNHLVLCLTQELVEPVVVEMEEDKLMEVWVQLIPVVEQVVLDMDVV
tara:strand:- start:86 stop:418 length:333 start_codon:yes stop_codon:yes gene_type:complete